MSPDSCELFLGSSTLGYSHPYQALCAGLGIGFAATWLAGREPSLERVLPEFPMPRLPVWLTVHREIRSSGRIRALYDFPAEVISSALA